MDALFALLRALRLALDLLLLVLDLNFFLVSSLVSALLWLLSAACGLPAAAAGGALACWDAAVLALARGCCGGLEGLRALARLAAQAALRGRELAQRGLGAALGCGQALGRQACEALAIAGSLLVYLANSLVNVCLLGAQNLLTLLAALWDSLAVPALRLSELLAALLAHVSSGAIAVSILLWSPCQLALELLCTSAQIFVSVFFVNVYGLGLLLLIVAVGTFLLNPGLPWTLAGHFLGYIQGYFHALPAFQRLKRDAWRLYQVAILSVGMAMTSQPWRRLAHWVLQLTDWSLQVTNWSRGGRGTNRGSDQRGAVAVARALGQLLDEEQVAQPRPGNRAGTAHGRVAVGRLLDEDEEQLEAGQMPLPRPALSRAAAAQHPQAARQEPGPSWGKAPRKQQLNATAGNAEGAPDNDPWVLLKEQEERKKCVICQDQTKTVLLLPCRHLCLCQECTEVLLQQAIYQRNCPLCRQMILQTLNVYL
ncbi:E3 ubiquitin-protein ligase RNF26 [Empidonax traillii]|uniref:E3 ubiquitin-protein ligase RNF26 n=1 Tax=Empidonax traillii TaxID=164674 RepID=UPI000FFCF207|nr:E3 ubiquitin-protein ligase RNF26 [Empidonax traillii]